MGVAYKHMTRLGHCGRPYFERHLGVLVQEWDVKHQPPEEVLHHGGTQLPAHREHRDPKLA